MTNMNTVIAMGIMGEIVMAIIFTILCSMVGIGFFGMTYMATLLVGIVALGMDTIISEEDY